jgi:hypothetical protein
MQSSYTFIYLWYDYANNLNWKHYRGLTVLRHFYWEFAICMAYYVFIIIKRQYFDRAWKGIQSVNDSLTLKHLRAFTSACVCVLSYILCWLNHIEYSSIDGERCRSNIEDKSIYNTGLIMSIQRKSYWELHQQRTVIFNT